MVNVYDSEFGILIASGNLVPIYRYDSRNDDDETGFQVFYSKKYLRRQKKLNYKKRAATMKA